MPSEEISLSFTRAVLHGKVVIGVTVGVTVTLVLVFMLLRPHLYESRAIILIGDLPAQEGTIPFETVPVLRARLLAQFGKAAVVKDKPYISSVNPAGAPDTAEIIVSAQSQGTATALLSNVVNQTIQDYRTRQQEATAGWEKQLRQVDAAISAARESLSLATSHVQRRSDTVTAVGLLMAGETFMQQFPALLKLKHEVEQDLGPAKLKRARVLVPPVPVKRRQLEGVSVGVYGVAALMVGLTIGLLLALMLEARRQAHR